MLKQTGCLANKIGRKPGPQGEGSIAEGPQNGIDVGQLEEDGDLNGKHREHNAGYKELTLEGRASALAITPH